MSELRIQYPHAEKEKKRLFTLKEASTYLGVSVDTVRRLIWSGKLNEVRISYKVHIDVADLDKLVERSKSTFTF